jgi:hypothetical protein
MGDFDLTGLDPRKFEHLIQALALDAIGGDVTPFGDGPDGGREATFDGPMHYPSFVEPWDGYLVIQCKFQQKPGTTKDQGKWALDQLEGDLKKFLDPKRKLRKPEYYLFVTNVVLTPVPETGSKDKVLALLESYRERLGLKAYAVWDYDKLCRLLDANPGVRQTYAGSITPGDVLSIMMDRVPSIGKSFWYLMPLFLQREFVGDLYARLEQFNDSGDRPISLGNVFVDLPAFEEYDSEPPDESDLDRLPAGVVGELLQSGAEVLKSSALAAIVSPSSQSGSSGAPEPGRFVIVGGPGQGKSTVGQFLCQLYRAAILRDLPERNLERDTLDGIRKLTRECAEAGMALPATQRFPVRIVLDRFANALAEKKCASLLGYAASRVSRATRCATPMTCANGSKDMRGCSCSTDWTRCRRRAIASRSSMKSWSSGAR